MYVMNRDIKIYQVGMSCANQQQIEAWLSDLGVTASDIKALENIPEQERIIAVAAKRCYNSFSEGLNPNVTRLRRDYEQYFENLMKSGHGSVLEHVTFNYAIEGLTRVATGELNRHRAGVAISEGSMRYIRLDEGISWWKPFSLTVDHNDEPEMIDKKEKSLEIFMEIFANVEEAYTELCRIWEVDKLPFSRKKELTSMFRRIVPMGVQTGGVWTFNVRALRHILELRSSEHAEEEIRYIARTICDDLITRHPWLFGDFNNYVPVWKKV